MDVKKIKPFDGIEGSKIRNIIIPYTDKGKSNFSIAHITLKKGKRTKVHKLKSYEIYYILNGSGILFVNDKKIKVKDNHLVFVSSLSKQHIENSGTRNLEFLCIVNPPWKKEDEIILE